MTIHVAQVVIVGVLCCPWASSRAADLDEILLLHEASLERLSAIDAELVIKRVTKDAGTVDSSILCTWRENFADQLRRISIHYPDAPADSKRSTYHVFVDKDSSYKLLRNFDFEQPATLGPNVKTTVDGDVGIVAEMIPGGYDPRSSLLMLVDSAPARTLREAIGEAHEPTVAGTEEVDGHPCVVLDLPFPPGDLDSATTKWSNKVSLDPNAGYMIRQIVATSAPFKVNGVKEPVTVTVTASATDFQEFANGVFLPTSTRTERSDSKFISIVEAEYVSVNQAPEREEIDFQFPEWCWVRDLTSGDTLIADGEGGKLTSWSNPSEMNAWFTKNYPQTSPFGASRWLVIGTAVFGLLIVVRISMAVIRRRRGQ